MTMTKKAMEANTTLSKWEKGDIKRVYENSTILRWFNVKIYYDKGEGGYTRVNQIGKLPSCYDTLVSHNLAHWLKEKGSPFYDDECGWFQFPERFDDFWNAVQERENENH